MNLNNSSTVNAFLTSLEKAVATSDITAIVPEDLEIEAHNTLWSESSPGQLTMLKLLPTVPAYAIDHKFARITSYGDTDSSGWFGERSLPPGSNFASDQITARIALMGDVGETYLLADQERTVKALGTNGAANIQDAASRLRLLFKKNRNILFSDTTTHRDGSSSVRGKGILQIIKADQPNNIIDMRGDPLTVATIRSRMAESYENFGAFNTLIMSPRARVALETSLDQYRKLELPAGMAPYMLGQMVRGVQTDSGTCFFEKDMVLAPKFSRPQYAATVRVGAPSTLCTATASAGADGSSPDVSKFAAGDAGNYFYVITEIVGEVEGLGRRVPASGYVAVTTAQEVTLTITPSSSAVESFRIYRGTDASGASANTDAWMIKDVASSTTGSPVVTYDDNLYLPNTSMAFALRINSASAEAMHAASPTAYDEAKLNSAAFLENSDRTGNTVALAHLGPHVGVLTLADVIATARRRLLWSAYAMEIRNSLQNYVFINIDNS